MQRLSDTTFAVTTEAVDGLYVHTPFCEHKCHYCDFYSLVEREGADRQPALVDALIAELGWWTDRGPLRPGTVFVGGGTPTLLRPALWRRLLAAMGERGVLERAREFTVEANPESVSEELMGVLAEGGVNRVSMGAQSFDPALLKTLERWHDPANVARAVRCCRSAGIRNFNLDLIFAIPGQTMAQLHADLDAALALEPTHLSCYSLIFEPNTALTAKMKLGQVQPVDEELEREMYAAVIDRLAEAGFEHYEVSAWARKVPGSGVPEGYRCLHNLLYWRNGNWVGVGPSAASHVEGQRWKNEAHLGRYLAHVPEPPIVDPEHLPAEQRVGERLMMQLRTSEGVELAWLEAALGEGDPRWQRIGDYEAMGLLEREATHLRLTRRGLFVADALVSELLSP